MIDRRGVVAIVVFLAGAVAFGWLHLRAGLTLPVPWQDEAHFLWPARSLAQHGTLAAPELHPDRALSWMPPGYAVVIAAVFSVTGPSLVVARHVSALCVVAAAGSIALLPRDRIVGAVVAALWLLSPSVIAIGNVARMEALLLALVLAGFVALDRDRVALGLAALSVGAAVHPNGLVFLAAGAAWIAITRARVRPRDGVDRLVLVLGVSAAAIAWIVTLAGEGNDLRFQLERKVDRDLLSPWLDRRTLVAALLAATLFVADRRRERGLFVAAGLAALVARNVGREMWYAAFDPLFYALVAFALLDVAHVRRRGTGPALAIAAALAVIAWPDRPRSPAALQWRGMALHDDPYATPSTFALVLDALPADARIEVLPRGDAALFLDRDAPAFVDPVRYAFTPDATLVHLSDHQPRHMQIEPRDRLAAAASTAEPIADGWWLIRR